LLKIEEVMPSLLMRFAMWEERRYPSQ